MTTNTELFDEIRELVVSARRTVARGVDLVQVYTNFEIGRRIVLEEQRGEDRAAYGQEILKSLAARLMGEFGKGFSLTNLKFMRQFYLQNQYRIGQSVTDQFGEEGEDRSLAGTSPAFEKRAVEASASGQPPSPPFTLSWTHYVFLLGIQDPAERRFYEIEAAAQDWTVRELKRQFDSSLYERLALSRDKEGVRKLAQEGQKIAQPHDVFVVVLGYVDRMFRVEHAGLLEVRRVESAGAWTDKRYRAITAKAKAANEKRLGNTPGAAVPMARPIQAAPLLSYTALSLARPRSSVSPCACGP